MPQKNKPQSPLNFCVNADPGAKCEKRGMKREKNGAKYPVIYFLFFAPMFAYFAISIWPA